METNTPSPGHARICEPTIRNAPPRRASIFCHMTAPQEAPSSLAIPPGKERSHVQRCLRRQQALHKAGRPMDATSRRALPRQSWKAKGIRHCTNLTGLWHSITHAGAKGKFRCKSGAHRMGRGRQPKQNATSALYPGLGCCPRLSKAYKTSVGVCVCLHVCFGGCRDGPRH